MKFNKEAMQNQLDLAAHELQRAGFMDLAEKVDYYAFRMMTASISELPLIKRALSRLEQEAKKRLDAMHKVELPEDADKAQKAVMNARRAADPRKETLARRLKTLVAKRQQAKRKLEALRASRTQRRSAKEARKRLREERLSKKS
jgi:hypothetical protein